MWQSRSNNPTARAFDEHNAMELIEKFIVKLWEGNREPAKFYLEEASLPVILTYAIDGTYAAAMSSQDDMENFVECLTHQLDNATNMDW